MGYPGHCRRIWFLNLWEVAIWQPRQFRCFGMRHLHWVIIASSNFMASFEDAHVPFFLARTSTITRRNKIRLFATYHFSEISMQPRPSKHLVLLSDPEDKIVFMILQGFLPHFLLFLCFIHFCWFCLISIHSIWASVFAHEEKFAKHKKTLLAGWSVGLWCIHCITVTL